MFIWRIHAGLCEGLYSQFVLKRKKALETYTFGAATCNCPDLKFPIRFNFLLQSRYSSDFLLAEFLLFKLTSKIIFWKLFFPDLRPFFPNITASRYALRRLCVTVSIMVISCLRYKLLFPTQKLHSRLLILKISRLFVQVPWSALDTRAKSILHSSVLKWVSPICSFAFEVWNKHQSWRLN